MKDSPGAGGAVLGHVVGVNVDGGIGGFLNEVDVGGIAVGAGDTVGLAFGGFNHQEDATVVSESLIELKGEGVTLADDGGVRVGLPHGGEPLEKESQFCYLALYWGHFPIGNETQLVIDFS